MQPKDTVRFITKFTTFADPYVPYMFHCHLLHHEDDGMMGTFLVIDPATIGIKEQKTDEPFRVMPNPTNSRVKIVRTTTALATSFDIYDALGKIVHRGKINDAIELDVSLWPKGIYFISLESNEGREVRKILIN